VQGKIIFQRISSGRWGFPVPQLVPWFLSDTILWICSTIFIIQTSPVQPAYLKTRTECLQNIGRPDCFCRFARLKNWPEGPLDTRNVLSELQDRETVLRLWLLGDLCSHRSYGLWHILYLPDRHKFPYMRAIKLVSKLQGMISFRLEQSKVKFGTISPVKQSSLENSSSFTALMN